MTDQLTALIQQEIKRQYKSVRKFTTALDLPYTTVTSALKNGIGGTAYETVTKICAALHIQLINYQNNAMINEDVLEFLYRYNRLDEKGMHTVRTILEMEYRRCTDNPITSPFIENK